MAPSLIQAESGEETVDLGAPDSLGNGPILDMRYVCLGDPNFVCEFGLGETEAIALIAERHTDHVGGDGELLTRPSQRGILARHVRTGHEREPIRSLASGRTTFRFAR